MTKLEFLKELESLLSDIPLDEREEALSYYKSYFEEAGEDREEEIIREIGSPSKVAAIIKADLNSNAADRENRGFFTEKGYEDSIYPEEKYELVGSNTGNDSTKNSNTEGYEDRKSSNTSNNTDNAHDSQNAKVNYQQRKNDSDKTALYLLLGIFTFPIWLPILLSALGVAIGIIAAVLSIIFGFGVAGITMMGVGVALFFTGIIQISVPFIGILVLGVGSLLLGLGMLFIIVCILLSKNVLPAFIRGVVNLCRLPFRKRSVMA